MNQVPIDQHPRGLRAIRLEHGYAQERVARQTGLSTSTIRAIEGGSRRCSRETAEKIAGLFGVDVADLWGDDVR